MVDHMGQRPKHLGSTKSSQIINRDKRAESDRGWGEGVATLVQYYCTQKLSSGLGS